MLSFSFNDCEFPCDAQQGGDDEHPDRRQSHSPDCEGRRDDRTDDEGHDSRAHAFEGGVDDRVLADVGEKERDGQDDDERRQHGAQQGRHGAAEAADLVAHEHRGVDGDRPRDRLREGQQVEELLLLDPLAFGDELPLDQRKHGVAAAEGEEPDFEE